MKKFINVFCVCAIIYLGASLAAGCGSSTGSVSTVTAPGGTVTTPAQTVGLLLSAADLKGGS